MQAFCSFLKQLRLKNGVNCREALLGNCYQVGDPQPSCLSNKAEGSEAIRPASLVDDEMVHATKKLVGYV